MYPFLPQLLLVRVFLTTAEHNYSMSIPWLNSSFLSSTEWHTIVSFDRSLSIPSLTEGRLGCCQGLATMSGAATHTHMLLCGSGFSGHLGTYQGSWFLDRAVGIRVIRWQNANSSQAVETACISASVSESSGCSMLGPAFWIWTHSYGCSEAPHCCSEIPKHAVYLRSYSPSVHFLYSDVCLDVGDTFFFIRLICILSVEL